MGIAAIRQSFVEYAYGIAKSMVFWIVAVPTTILSVWEVYVPTLFPALAGWPIGMTLELFTLLIVVALLLGGFSAYHRLRTAKAEAQLSVIKLTPSGGATLTGEVSDAAIEAVTAGWASHSRSIPLSPRRRSRTPVAGQSAAAASETLWQELDTNGGG